jgi:hypothetical protein
VLWNVVVGDPLPYKDIVKSVRGQKPCRHKV